MTISSRNRERERDRKSERRERGERGRHLGKYCSLRFVFLLQEAYHGFDRAGDEAWTSLKRI